MKINSVMIACIVFLMSGCTTTTLAKNNSIKKRHVHYEMALLPPDWQKKSFRGADLFFEHKSKDALIFVNAQCQKLSDSPLIALTAQMLGGMGKYEIISQKSLKLSEREALISEVNATMDGVARYLKIMVLRKNRCLFDAVLSLEHFDDSLVKDFDELVASFSAEAEL